MYALADMLSAKKQNWNIVVIIWTIVGSTDITQFLLRLNISPVRNADNKRDWRDNVRIRRKMVEM